MRAAEDVSAVADERYGIPPEVPEVRSCTVPQVGAADAPLSNGKDAVADIAKPPICVVLVMYGISFAVAAVNQPIPLHEGAPLVLPSRGPLDRVGAGPAVNVVVLLR